MSFKDLFSNIFGESIYKQFIKNSKSSEIIEIKEKDELIKLSNLYREEKTIDSDRPENEIYCKRCKDVYNRQLGDSSFKKRNMMFPGWTGKLDPILGKKIMIIGESVTLGLKEITEKKLLSERHFSIGWDLNIWENSIQEINEENKYTEFWRSLKILFKDKKDENENWINSLFTTDLGFCNCNSEPMRYLTCANLYLCEQIKLIKPELILLLGEKACEGFISVINGKKEIKMDLINFDIQLKKTEKFNRNFYTSNKIRAGYITLDEKIIYFLGIPHTAPSSAIYNIDRSNSREEVWEVLQNKLIESPIFSKFFK